MKIVQHYVNALKSHDLTEVFFNIIGRIAWQKTYYKVFDRAYDDYEVSIIFDLKPYQDQSKVDFRKLPDSDIQKRSFYLNTMDDNSWSEKGESMAYCDMGFMLSPRVAPKLFCGVVLQRPGARPINSWKYTADFASKKEIDDKFLERVQQIGKMQLVIDKNNQDLLVPVYDTLGNLCWPKQMNYEEVKAYVAERDAKKAQNQVGVEPEENPAENSEE
jgi:hypothetical protein